MKSQKAVEMESERERVGLSRRGESLSFLAIVVVMALVASFM